MKTLPSLDSIDALERFKRHLSESVDNEIERRKIYERMASIDNMSFGQMKNLFESLGDRLFNINKSLIGCYVRTIKENKDLRNLYALYESAISPSYTKNSQSLVNAMITLRESLNNDNIRNGEAALRIIVKEAVASSNIKSDEFDAIMSDKQEINESLDYIFGVKQTAKNLFEHTNKRDFVEKYINENMKSENETVVSESVDPKETVKSFNNLMEGLELWEAEVVKDLTLCHLAEDSGEKLFEQYKNECLDLINEKIDGTESVEEISHLKLMKEQLSQKQFDKEKLDEDLIKLADLKRTLGE